MILKVLDETLKSWASRNTPSVQHFYIDALSLAHAWLTITWGLEGGGYPMMIPVAPKGRVIDIPDGFSLSTVGIDKNGSFTPLGVNNQMVSVDDGCFDHGDRLTGHPDHPTSATSAGWWPGQPGGQSSIGYYRHFDHKNLVLLDSEVGAKHKELLLKGSIKIFQPYRLTKIDERWVAPLEAYIEWKMGINSGANYSMRMETMRQLISASPAHAYISAIMAGTSRI